MTITLTPLELQTLNYALAYAYENLDSDMSLMDPESQTELRNLAVLKDRLAARAKKINPEGGDLCSECGKVIRVGRVLCNACYERIIKSEEREKAS